MQGKALVVNPAVIQPSAPPTIVVGRVRGGEDSCGPVIQHGGIPVKRHRGEPGHTRDTGKKTPEEPGRTRDTHGTHGIHGRTDHTVEPHNHPNPTTVDTPAPGRTTRRDGRYR